MILLLPVVLSAMPRTAWGATQKAATTPPAPPESLNGQEFYASAKPYLDDPRTLSALPELHGLKPAKNQDELGPLLDKLGEQLKAMVGRIPDLTSLEVVSQTKTLPEALRHSDYTVPPVPETHEYSYLILSHQAGGAVSLEEFRTALPDKRGKPADVRRDFMLTKGFALKWAHFYPSNRAECRFRFLGRQNVDRRPTFVLAFAQKPGFVRSPAEIRFKDRTVHILEQGIAWVDEADYHVLRMRTDMLAPRPDIHVRALVTKARYGEVHTPQLDTPLWLPQEVLVYIHCDAASYQNVHRYSQYRLFRATSKILPIEASDHP